MNTNTSPKPILLAFRAEDSEFGVTRRAVQRMAQIKGLNETSIIHLALAQMAREMLPRYERDDGPITPEMAAAIQAEANKFLPTGPVIERRTLFPE